jgi:hypothetical protein
MTTQHLVLVVLQQGKATEVVEVDLVVFLPET